MIKLYNRYNNITKEEIDVSLANWMNIYSPTSDDISFLIKENKFEECFINYCLDENEISRIINKVNKKLILLDVPVTDDREEILFSTVSLGIVIEEDKVSTICSREYIGLSDFVTNKIEVCEDNVLFILNIIDRITRSYLNHLKILNEEALNIENTLKAATKNSEIFKLMNIQKSLVYLRTSLISNSRLLELLSEDLEIVSNLDYQVILKNIIVENKQAIETASIYSEILNGMMEAFGSVVSNNLNLIMKFLAGITIVFSVPTMIYSFMGMNVDLGYLETADNAMIIILVFSTLLSIVLAYFLKKKNML